MSVNSSSMEFDANADKAANEIKKLVESQNALEQSIKQMANASEKASQQAVGALKNQGVAVKAVADENSRLRAEMAKLRGESDTTFTRMQKGWGEVKSAFGAAGIGLGISSLIAQQGEWNTKIAETSRLLDEQGRKYQVQALIQDKAFRAQMQAKLLPQMQAAATPIAQGLETATEMISQGFSRDAVEGGALQEMLIGARAQNKVSTKDYAFAVTSWLKSQKQDLTKENVRGTMMPLTNLFQSTALQASDLGELAPIGALTQQFNMKPDDTLAAFTTLKEKMPAGEAATALRNFTVRLGTASGDPERLSALRELGGKGFEKKVDFQGESFEDVLINMKSALDRKQPEDRNVILAKIFGTRAIQGGSTLLDNIESYQKFKGIERDNSKFETGVKLATAGPAAADIRIANEGTIAEDAAGREALRLKQLRDINARKEIQAGIPAWAVGTMTKATEALNWFGLETNANVFTTQELNRKLGGTAVKPMGGGPAGAFVPKAIPKFTGKLDPAIDWAGDAAADDPLDKQIRAEEVKHLRAEAALQKARLEATDPNSPGGAKITHAEQKLLQPLERQINLISQLLSELRAQRKEQPKKEILNAMKNRLPNVD